MAVCSKESTASSGSPPRGLPLLARLGVAVAIPCAALLLVLPAQRIIHSVRLIFFVPAVIGVGWLAGEAPGVLAALLAGSLANRFALSTSPGFDTSFAGLASTTFFWVLTSVLAIGASRLRARDTEARALAGEVARRLELEQAARAAERAEAEERARIAEALRRSERRLRSLITATAQMIWTTTPGGDVVEDSPSWRAFTGQTYEEFRGWGWLDALHPEDYEEAGRGWREAVAAKRLYEVEYRVQRPDGAYTPTLARGTPVLDDGGAVVEWVVANSDISARVAAERAIRESEERFRTLVEALPQLVFTAGPDGTLDFHNRQFLEYSGLESEDLVGVGWTRLLHPDDIPVASEGRRRILESGQPRAFELRLRRRDGVYRWFLVSVTPLRGLDGRVTKWFGTCTDIQVQKEAAQAQAEAVHARDVFLSVASHELRTPLTAAQLQIQSALRQYRREAPEGSASAFSARLDATAASVERLGKLVNALLDVSQVAAGKFVTCRDPVDLSALVTQSVERLSDAALKSGSEVGLEVEQGVSIIGDDLRLEQMVTNLLSNAIKYGEGRPIAVRLRRSGQRAVLSVVDRGIGISPGDQVRIFDRFERAASARHYGGLGLGLWIARQIVQASGGVLRVVSAPGRGSTFTVELPLEREAEATAPSLAGPARS